LSRKGVAVTAFGPNPDGEGIVLRLWEMAGTGGVCRVRLPEGLREATAQPCNLRGQPNGEALKVENGVLAVPLTPFAPASVILKP
jgi:alpha-mannosidase